MLSSGASAAARLPSSASTCSEGLPGAAWWTTGDMEARTALSRMRTDVNALAAEDIAESIAFATAAPPNVNVAEMVVAPVDQG